MTSWRDALLLPNEPLPGDERVWELFHENSKATRWMPSPSPAAIAEQRQRRSGAHAWEGLPRIELPSRPRLPERALGDVLLRRRSASAFMPHELSIAELGTLLFAAYGPLREVEDAAAPVRRASPSGGALYPLDLFVCSDRLGGVEPGLFHYDAAGHGLERCATGPMQGRLAEAFFQTDLLRNAQAIILCTAIFEHTTFKYGARGYRFALLEAGHVMQTLSLVAAALDLGSVNLGGYVDREVDAFLGIDGVTQATVYACAIGQAL